MPTGRVSGTGPSILARVGVACACGFIGLNRQAFLVGKKRVSPRKHANIPFQTRLNWSLLTCQHWPTFFLPIGRRWSRLRSRSWTRFGGRSWSRLRGWCWRGFRGRRWSRFRDRCWSGLGDRRGSRFGGRCRRWLGSSPCKIRRRVGYVTVADRCRWA